MYKKMLAFLTVIVLLIVMVIFSATTGSLDVTLVELVQGLMTGSNEKVNVIKDLRLPRIIVALFAGAALAVSGALLQAVVRNPLAEAGIIGVSAGAAFMTILLLSIFPTLFFWSPLFAFLGGALAFLLVYSLSWKSGLNPLRLILVGVAINALFTGLSELFDYRGSYAVTSVSRATTSTLTMKTWGDVQIVVIYVSIGLVLALLLTVWCNLLLLQDKTAFNLGLHVSWARLIISAVAILLAAVATAIAGVIAFIGLIVPHIGRLIVGSDYKLLIPFSALAGSLLILTADTLGRTIIPPNEIPASIIMAIIGGPFLIFLLRKSEQVYGT